MNLNPGELGAMNACITRQDVQFQAVQADDFESLFVLRMDAIRDSLMRLGRWNPERSRQRFAAAFDPPHMHHIVLRGEKLGFMTLKPIEDQGEAILLLEHLYICNGHQGKGLGAIAVAQAQGQARAHHKPLVLYALKYSDSNRFYLRHGFVQTGEDEMENRYRWVYQGAAA